MLANKTGKNTVGLWQPNYLTYLLWNTVVRSTKCTMRYSLREVRCNFDLKPKFIHGTNCGQMAPSNGRVHALLHPSTLTKTKSISIYQSESRANLNSTDTLNLCLVTTGQRYQPHPHRVPSVAHKPRPVRVLHQRGLVLLPGPGWHHWQPAYRHQWPRARAVTQQREGHRSVSLFENIYA